MSLAKLAAYQLKNLIWTLYITSFAMFEDTLQNDLTYQKKNTKKQTRTDITTLKGIKKKNTLRFKSKFQNRNINSLK